MRMSRNLRQNLVRTTGRSLVREGADGRGEFARRRLLPQRGKKEQRAIDGAFALLIVTQCLPNWMSGEARVRLSYPRALYRLGRGGRACKEQGKQKNTELGSHGCYRSSEFTFQIRLPQASAAFDLRVSMTFGAKSLLDASAGTIAEKFS